MSTKKILHRMWIFVSVASSMVIAVTMSSDKMLRSPSYTPVKAPETKLTPEAWNWVERNVIPRLTPENYPDFLRRITESPYTDALMSVKQAASINWTDRAIRNLEKYRRTVGIGYHTNRLESIFSWFVATIIPIYLIGIFEYAIFYGVSTVWTRIPII